MRTSSGISLDFMNIYLYPKSYSKTLTPIACIVKDSFASIFHKNCSYFIHRQSCFLLSKRVVTHKDAFCDKISAHSSFHLQLQQKFFSLLQDRRNYASCLFKQLPSFSQACHFVHQNMGHSVKSFGCTTAAASSQQTRVIQPSASFSGNVQNVFDLLKYQHFTTQT